MSSPPNAPESLAHDASVADESEKASELTTSLLPRDDDDDDDDDEDAGPSVGRRRNRNGATEAEDGNGKEEEDADDDLFGADDDDDEAEEEEEDAIKRPNRSQRRRVSSQSPALNSSTPQDPLAERARSQSAGLDSSASEGDEELRRRREALELRETSADPLMGFRQGGVEGGEEEEAQVATFALPSLPVRRGLAHFYARLPNLLQYRAEEFDESTFDEQVEDELLQNREGIRIDDAGLRSLLTTNNTIRWRYAAAAAAAKSGNGKAESNARIVRWNDGSTSLQLGDEFYDITTAVERVQTASSAQSSSQAEKSADQAQRPSMVPAQPVQHLTHLFVKHDGQDQVNVFQAEAPIAGSMTFRSSITSESHQRLAKAVRQQRGALVKETVTKEDPELEKERFEREEKKKKQIRARELRKRKPQDDDEDDAFWASAGRSVLRGGRGAKRANGVPFAPATTADDLDDVDEGELAGLDAADDDGFVVDDEDDEDDDGMGSDDGERLTSRRKAAEMELDDEPDEIDRLEAAMERQEAERLASKAAAGDVDAKAKLEGEPNSGARRKRIVESDDDE